MRDHFQGSNHVELQPGDRNYPVKFNFNPASASTANDGSIPYGSTIMTVETTVKDQKGIDATTSVLSSSVLSGNSVIVYISHSSDVRDGHYTLTTKIGISLSGSTLIFNREFDFRRLYLRDE